MNHVFNGEDFKDYGYVVAFVSNNKYSSIKEVCGNKKEILNMIEKMDISKNSYNNIGISSVISYEMMMKKIKLLEEYIRENCM
jgi:AAA+ superfamily predicted ATPase